MSVHLEARPGEIAPIVLLPGDPLRAQFIAERFLEDAVCHNRVRNALGFTGTYKGTRVSVQSTGMGMPSAAIYIHELLAQYGVRVLIRIGTCGAIRENIARPFTRSRCSDAMFAVRRSCNCSLVTFVLRSISHRWRCGVTVSPSRSATIATRDPSGDAAHSYSGATVRTVLL